MAIPISFPNSTVPATNAAVVTPSDSTDFAFGVSKALYVGGTGNMVVVTQGGDAVTFSAIPVGTIIPIQAKRINSTSTTATLIVAMY